MTLLRSLAGCSLATLALLRPGRPRQAWPTARPITMVVPFPPGPALDLVARLVGDKIGPALGQTVVVENRTGANGTIGSNMVARAAPDGYTLLAATAGTHVTAVHLMKNLPYDPIKDFTPIVAAVEPVTCLAVNASLPVNSVRGADRLRQGAAGRAVVRQLRRRLGVPPDGRAVQRDRRRARSITCPIAASRRRCRTSSAATSR